MFGFLQASAENCINLEVIGKRKFEVGLAVLAKYNAFTRNKKIARGETRTAATSKMERFVIIVNGWKQ